MEITIWIEHGSSLNGNKYVKFSKHFDNVEAAGKGLKEMAMQFELAMNSIENEPDFKAEDNEANQDPTLNGED